MNRIFAILVLATLLSACSQNSLLRPPKGTPEKLWQARQLKLAHIDSWSLTGRAVVREKKEGWNLGLRWQQQQDSFDIHLLGPFSQGGAQLTGDNHHAVLTLDNGERLTASDPQRLLRNALGVELPVAALKYWIRGLPDQQQRIQHLELDQQGQIIRLTQQGWQVEFKRYAQFEFDTLPAKIFISQPDRSLRLVITHWQNIK